MMPKIWRWVKISTLEVMVFSSLALTAQAVQSAIPNSHSLPISPILISQAYGNPNALQFEPLGDSDMKRGHSFSQNHDYDQAAQFFLRAADYYSQCYSEMLNQGDRRASEVEKKYFNAKKWAENMLRRVY